MQSPEEVICEGLAKLPPSYRPLVALDVIEKLHEKGYLIIRGTQPDETGRLYYATGEFAGKANL